MKEPPTNPQAQPPDIDSPLSADELRSVGVDIAHEFPLQAQPPGLLLLDVDPFHLHVYWNQDAAAIEAGRRDMAARGEVAHLVIRFRELPPDELPQGSPMLPLEVFDLELASPHGDAEVRLSGSGKRFEAELGITAADGGWLSLARSNPVRLPPAAPVSEPGFATWDSREARPPVEQIHDGDGDVERPAAAEAVPELDPSLRGGAADELIPIFPNLHPLPLQPVPDEAGGTVEVSVPHRDVLPGAEQPALALPGGLAPEPRGHQGGTSSYGMILELQAELLLHGRAASAPEVKWFDYRIPVNSQGEFSLTLPIDTSNPLLPLLVGKPKTGRD